MKCIKCDYPLWNLRQPRCPECGEEFDVRDWRFNSEHVAFQCTQCQEKLGPYKPGPIDKTCPACGKVIDWSSVTVVPLIDDDSFIALRKPIQRIKPKFSYGMLAIAICVALGGFCAFAPILPRRHGVSYLLHPILGLIGGAIVALIGVASAKKEYRTMNMVIWMSLLILWSLWIIQTLDR